MNLRKANQASQRGVQLSKDLPGLYGAVVVAILVRYYIHTLEKSYAWIYSKQTRCWSLSHILVCKRSWGKKKVTLTRKEKKR